MLANDKVLAPVYYILGGTKSGEVTLSLAVINLSTYQEFQQKPISSGLLLPVISLSTACLAWKQALVLEFCLIAPFLATVTY